MSESSRHRRFPLGALLGAAVLIFVAVTLVGLSRVTGLGTTPNPESVPVERRQLRFEDRSDGAVVVSLAGTERVVHVLDPGTNGFIRSVLRGMVRERRARGVGPDPSFHLTRWADGRLSLEDPATGRSIELDAFGPTNTLAFAQLLSADAAGATTRRMP